MRWIARLDEGGALLADLVPWRSEEVTVEPRGPQVGGEERAGSDGASRRAEHAVAWDRAGEERRRAAAEEELALELRRLRYFRDLLCTAWRHARGGSDPHMTLRTERLALAIGLPELDAVVLWSHRAADGTIALPFVEYLVSQLRLAAATLAGRDEALRRRAGRPLRQLLRLLAERRDLDAGHDALPRLRDVFLPEEWLDRICAAGGLADQLVLACAPAREPLEPTPAS